jgi:hypothetical protein
VKIRYEEDSQRFAIFVISRALFRRQVPLGVVLTLHFILRALHCRVAAWRQSLQARFTPPCIQI